MQRSTLAYIKIKTTPLTKIRNPNVKKSFKFIISFSFTDLKHEFGHVPKLLTADMEDNVGLSCFPPEGNPKPSIHWTKDGSVLNLSSAKYSLDPSGVLLVKGLNKDDEGRYECIVSNEAGTRTDSPVTLKVEDAPEDYVEEEEEQDNFLASPVLTESVLLDRITGLVHWLPVTHATGYTIQVSVDGVEITNIRVDSTVNQVKLHSLDPELTYTVAVAAQRQEALSTFSRPATLKRNHKEITVHITDPEGSLTEEDRNVWIIGMAVVTIITLMIVISAVVIFHKVAGSRAVKDVELYASEYGMPQKTMTYGNNKRYSWMDKRWAEAPISSFKSNKTTTGLLLDYNNHYDYVVNCPYSVPTSEDKKPQPGEMYTLLPGRPDIYHYASSPILKKDTLRPVKLQSI